MTAVPLIEMPVTALVTPSVLKKPEPVSVTDCPARLEAPVNLALPEVGVNDVTVAGFGTTSKPTLVETVPPSALTVTGVVAPSGT